jgi:hypothetical protein
MHSNPIHEKKLLFQDLKLASILCTALTQPLHFGRCYCLKMAAHLHQDLDSDSLQRGMGQDGLFGSLAGWQTPLIFLVNALPTPHMKQYL